MSFTWENCSLKFVSSDFCVVLEFDDEKTIDEFCATLGECLSREREGHIFNGSLGVSFIPHNGIAWKVSFGVGNHSAGLDVAFIVPREELSELAKK